MPAVPPHARDYAQALAKRYTLDTKADTKRLEVEYKDAMRQELRFRANLSNDKIRAHLATMADSIGLPEEAGDVVVTRNGNEVSVEAEYDDHD